MRWINSSDITTITSMILCLMLLFYLFYATWSWDVETWSFKMDSAHHKREIWSTERCECTHQYGMPTTCYEIPSVWEGAAWGLQGATLWTNNTCSLCCSIRYSTLWLIMSTRSVALSLHSVTPESNVADTGRTGHTRVVLSQQSMLVDWT